MPKPRMLVCACHAKVQETHCPSCGARLRRADGTVKPAAALLVMGLAMMNCADDESNQGASSTDTTSSSDATTMSSTDSVTTTEAISAYAVSTSMGGFGPTSAQGGAMNVGGNGGDGGNGGSSDGGNSQGGSGGAGGAGGN